MAETNIEVRCYCHGLGDCMLLTLRRKDGTPYRMLIDCGLHSATKGGPEKMRRVVEDLVAATRDDAFPGGKIDVIVGTHEHWDHLSAFLQEAETFSRMEVGEVWFSWAENPRDEDARKLDRFKTDAAAALVGAAARMAATGQLPDVQAGLDGMLGFSFGAKGERVRDARENLRGLAATRHLEPGTVLPIPGVPGIRVYVLGPPRDPKLLGIEDIRAETYGMAFGATSTSPMASALGVLEGSLDIDDDPAAPFDSTSGVSLAALAAGEWGTDPGTDRFFWQHYVGPDQQERDQAWRRIDGDWLANSVDLALQLDSRTNNTSLVLALEIIETGRVFLFAADAQIGNWMSWPAVRFALDPANIVTGDDLISRTVFYKVGHHGSRNATRTAGLEGMNHAQLVAFSPTDASMASSVKWKDFPAEKTAARLLEVTSGRFIQSDASWLHDNELEVPFRPGGALRSTTVKHGLYVDLILA